MNTQEKATEIVRVTPKAREKLMTIKAITKQTPAEQIDNFLFGDHYNDKEESKETRPL